MDTSTTRITRTTLDSAVEPDLDAEFVILGAGLMGAATAWQLARRGHEVTVLERTTPANAQGSSHGSARIFRQGYTDPLYAGLARQARAGWMELEHISGAHLFTPTGALDAGSRRDPVGLARILAPLGIEHELVSADRARERWPGLDLGTEVLWQPDAGVIDAETTVTTLLHLAAAAGARILHDWDVTRVERRGTGAGTGYLVTGADGRQVRAGHLVVCAGGWLPHLMARLPVPTSWSRGLAASLVVRQEQAYHLPYRTDGAEASGPWPAFIYKGEDVELFGLPGGRDAGFAGQKVARWKAGRPIASAADQDGRVDPEDRQLVIEAVTRMMPGLEPTPYAETTCLYTMTPREGFLIDRHEGITVVSACSGHGGKFTPLIGELAAGLATGTETVPEAFRLGSQGVAAAPDAAPARGGAPGITARA